MRWEDIAERGTSLKDLMSPPASRPGPRIRSQAGTNTLLYTVWDWEGLMGGYTPELSRESPGEKLGMCQVQVGLGWLEGRGS